MSLVKLIKKCTCIRTFVVFEIQDRDILVNAVHIKKAAPRNLNLFPQMTALPMIKRAPWRQNLIIKTEEQSRKSILYANYSSLPECSHICPPPD